MYAESSSKSLFSRARVEKLAFVGEAADAGATISAAVQAPHRLILLPLAKFSIPKKRAREVGNFPDAKSDNQVIDAVRSCMAS